MLMAINLTNFRPNLAASTDDYDWSKLQFPVYVSPKIDGIRCVTHPTLGPVSRSLKPIPNKFIRDYLAHPALRWLDGEIVVGPSHAADVFNQSQSGVMSHGGEPDFSYLVFDNFEAGHMCGFGIRINDASNVVDAAITAGFAHESQVRVLPQVMVHNLDELNAFEAGVVEDGFEGAMVRSPGGKYKFGRSTLREQGLLKMKRFIDDEAEIIGWEPLMRNLNDPVVDALGLQKRGYSKEGKVADDRLVGKFIVRGCAGSRWHNITFSIGSGLDDNLRLRYREAIRTNVDSPIGKKVAYKYQAHGSLEAPRMPIFKGLRYD